MPENPYSFLDAVLNTNMFYGYQIERDHIVSAVIAPKRASFLLLGGGRMGKTTLLRQIEMKLKESNINSSSDHPNLFVVPVYFDISLKKPTLGSFLGNIASELHHYLEDNAMPFVIPDQIKILLQLVKKSRDPERDFIRVLVRLKQAASPIQLRVLFLMDNLWRLHPEKQERLTSCLNTLYMNPSLDNSIAYIFASSYFSLDRLSLTNYPFYNLLIQKELHVFNKEEALRLINEPTKSMSIPTSVAWDIYMESGGNPFLMQYLMSKLCDKKDWKTLTRKDIQDAEKQFKDEREDFNNWWEKLNIEDQQIYEVFWDGNRHSAAELRDMGLINQIVNRGRNTIMDVSMISRTLRTLCTMGLIRRCEEKECEDQYELAGQWPARWFGKSPV